MKMNIEIQKKPKVENVENKQVKSSSDVYNLEIVQEIKDAMQEHFIFIGLDYRNNIRVITMLGIGSSNSVNIHSKDILKTALINACDKVVLVHNHPSNSLTPSKKDIYFSNVTNKFLKVFNIELLDHIIVTENSYKSMEKFKEIDKKYTNIELDFVDKVLLFEENKKLKEKLRGVESTMNNIEKNYKLSKNRYFHFHSSDEGYDYTIYDNKGKIVDGGLLEYTDIDYDNPSLNNIKSRLAEFTGIKEINTETIEEVSQDIIDQFGELEIKRLEKNKNNKIRGKDRDRDE